MLLCTGYTENRRRKEGEENIAKKPFAVRIDEESTMRFKALATVKDKDHATLFSSMVEEHVQTLNTEEKEAYEALLRLWQAKREG